MPPILPVYRAKRAQKRVIRIGEATRSSGQKILELANKIKPLNTHEHESLRSRIKIEEAHVAKNKAAINRALRHMSDLGYALEQKSFGLRASAKGLKEREKMAKESGKIFKAKVLHLQRKLAISKARRTKTKSLRVAELYQPHSDKRTTRSSSK